MSNFVAQSTLLGEKNVLRIKKSKKMNFYIEQAQNLLTDPAVTSVKLEALGDLIPKLVSITEIIKRLHPDLQQKSTLQRAPPLSEEQPSNRITSALVIELTSPSLRKDVKMTSAI